MALTVLDAGVVIALLERQDRHHDVAEVAVRAAIVGGENLVLPAAAYAEVMVNPSRTGPTAVDIVDAFVDQLPAAVAPVSRQIARRAAAFRSAQRALRLPDALVLATAAELRADRVLTTDRGLRAPGIVVDVIGGG